jgi:hypothetical protein
VKQEEQIAGSQATARNEYLSYLAWSIALAATAGSLFFSEVMDLPPCNLCWYQRIAMYPLVVVIQELLFQRQPEWGERHGPPTGEPPPDVPALFAKYGQDLGLDMDKVNAALRENRYQAKLERDRQDGQSLGVRQTPTFFVNGRQVRRLGVAELTAAIEAELRK